LPYAITYFYNVYGPREISEGPYATLTAIFKKRFREGLPLQVVLPGTQRRNFTHVDDIVSGLIAVGERGAGDNYGLGAPEAYSILELVQMFGAPIEMLPERRGNRMGSEADTRRARQELGWEPRNRIEDHIRAFIAEVKQTAV
jgi:UDP-glucose 4-epimerase